MDAMQINRMVNDALDARERSDRLAAQRSEFAAMNLPRVPAVYHGKLGADPAKWPEEAKAVREEYKSDLAAIGVKAPDLGGNPGGASASTAGAGEVAKLAAPGGLSQGQAAFAQALVLPS